MIAELILLGKLLGKTDLSKSTPSPVTRPTFFGRGKPPIVSKPQPKTKPATGPALGLKKYF